METTPITAFQNVSTGEDEDWGEVTKDNTRRVVSLCVLLVVSFIGIIGCHSNIVTC
jgi:hypothetical protein